ncbi:hypothetical protein ACOMHN_057664 [Nucella lapillus]
MDHIGPPRPEWTTSDPTGGSRQGEGRGAAVLATAHYTRYSPKLKIPNGQYYWTKQDPTMGQSDLPGRLQPMWPPRHQEADVQSRPGLKYTEAEHQAAMVLMRKEYNQQVEKLQKEHAEEVERVHGDYQLRLEDLRAEVCRLEQEVEKYRQLAGLERLSQAALSHAQAAQQEAGLEADGGEGGGSYQDGKVVALTGTPPQQQQSRAPGGWGQDGVGVNGIDSGSSLDPGACDRGPSKPIVNTRSPMKSLFWKRIQVHNMKTSKSSSSSGSNVFWENLDEPKINFDEFDDLFSKVPVKPKKKSKDSKPKTAARQSAKVIEAKRSQAVGILLSTIRLEMVEIEHAILHLDTSALDAEKFRAIFENRPQDDEIKLITKQLEKQPDVPLDKPEQFLHDLNQIPNCAERIFCFIFQTTFQESMSVIENKLNNLKMTCEMLTAGGAVKHIFGLLLALGNYMNGGSRTRGQADGFELEILPKLKDYKAKDNRTSLIHYLVMMYVQLYEMDDAGTENVKLPLPDPSDITQAGLVNFDDISKEMTRIRKDFELAESKAVVVLKKATPDTREPFESIMKAFFEKGKQDLADQQETVRECEKKFSETILFFCAKPKSGDKEVTAEYFFSLWHSFCQDFKDHWKKEQQRITKLRLRDAETKLRKMQETKRASSSIPTRPITQGGLLFEED